MFILQRIYSIFLTPFRVMFRNLGNRSKNAAVTACCVLMAVFLIAFYTVVTWEYLFEARTMDQMIGCVMLFVMVIFSIRGKLQQVRWNRFLFWGTEIAGAVMFAISFLHPVGSGYRAFSLMLMLVYPCIYYVWNDRGDYNTLFGSISWATEVTGLLYYLYCFYLLYTWPMFNNAGRIRAGMYNAKMFSNLGSVMVFCGIYMLLIKRKNVKWFLLAAASIGAGVSIVMMGASRLSMIEVAGLAVCFPIYYFKTLKSHEGATGLRIRLGRLLVIAVSVALFMAVGSWMVDTSVKLAVTKFAEENGYTEAQAEADSPDMTEKAVGRFDATGKNMDSFTSGRIHIWKGYAQFLNLLGNDFSKADWVALTRDRERHAHNNFLEYSYRYGVPLGILQTLLELYAGIIALKYLFGRKYKDPAFFFTVIFIMMFAVESLFDIATLPFERHAPFFYYLALVPMMYSPDEAETEKA